MARHRSVSTFLHAGLLDRAWGRIGVTLISHATIFPGTRALLLISLTSCYVADPYPFARDESFDCYRLMVESRRLNLYIFLTNF